MYAIMRLSADQLTCHVVVVQANLQAFVLQQFHSDIRYGVFICLSSVLPTDLVIIISGFCSRDEWIETVSKQTARWESLICMAAETDGGAVLWGSSVILRAFYSGVLLTFLKKKESLTSS